MRLAVVVHHEQVERSILSSANNQCYNKLITPGVSFTGKRVTL